MNSIDAYILNLNELTLHENTVNYFSSLLNNHEENRANRFFFEDLKFKYRLCRGALRYLLSIHTKVPPKNLNINYNKYGKPCLGNLNTPISFNISHSRDYAVIAISNTAIGIDIEKIESKTLQHKQLAQDIFSREERTALCNTPKEEEPHLFTDIWVRKEAFVKSIGMGLSFPLQDFCVPTAQSHGCLGKVKILENKETNWNIYSLPTQKNYCCAISSKIENVKIEIINLDNKYILDHTYKGKYIYG